MRTSSVLVHGATGFTGRLICEALERRGIPFAVSGRDAAKLEPLAAERHVIDLAEPATLERAIAGRTIVCAAAGPFTEIGEPMLAACARLGVNYIDTTAEQAFIARAFERYSAAAHASGACIVPAIGYSGALSDWLAHALVARVGGRANTVGIYYGITDPDGKLFGTSRGSKRSLLDILAGSAMQFVDGELVTERAAQLVGDFAWEPGDLWKAVSFPAPDAITIPSHTGARTVRSFLVVDASTARLVHLLRRVAPTIARAARVALAGRITRSPEGPDAAARAGAICRIRAEVTRGDEHVATTFSAPDPYGLTAELVAHAIDRALRGEMRGTGVVAPSVAFDAEAALAAVSLEATREPRSASEATPPRRAAGNSAR